MDRAHLDTLKQLHPLEVIIGQTFHVVGTGRWRKTIEHDSLVIDTQKQYFWWNSRGIEGDVFDWMGHLLYPGTYDKRQHFRDVVTRLNAGHVPTFTPYADSKAEVHVPPTLDPMLAWQYHRQLNKSARAWWCKELAAPDNETIADKAIEQYLLGYCPKHPLWKQATYTIPIYDEGRLVNVRHRLARPRNPKFRYAPELKGLGAHLFNSYLLPSAREVVIVAGEKKAIALSVRGLPAVSSTAGCLHFPDVWIPHFAKCEHIYVAFDPGEDDAAEVIAGMLGARAKIVHLPCKPDDLFVRGGTLTEFRQLMESP